MNPGDTALHNAVESNDLEAAELILRDHVNIHFKDEKGLTPLYKLVEKRMELFESLYAKKNEKFTHCALSDSGYKSLAEPGAKNDQFLMSLYKSDQMRIKKFKRLKEESLNVIRQNINENEKFVVMLLEHHSFARKCSEDTEFLNFHAACILHNPSIAERILEQLDDINQRVSVNCPIFPGYTSLHFASFCNLSTMEMLLAKGADLFVEDVKGVTSLEICKKLYNIKEMQLVLKSVPGWKDILFSDGKTKLMNYISSLHDCNSHKEFLQSLGKEIRATVTQDSGLWPGYTVLHVAVNLLLESDLQIIQDILTISTDIITTPDIHRSIPVHLAFRQNKLKIVELLLKHYKKSLNCLDNDNLSYLHIAAAVNNQQLTKKLLKIETNFNVAYKGEPLPSVKPGWTPLHTAARTKHAVVGRILLQHGANLLQTDARGFTAIHLILGTNYTSLGLSHLHVAVWKDKAEAIERLLDMGADIEGIIGKLEDEELAEFEGFRPIHVAMMNHTSVVAFKILLRLGANIFAEKLDGSSPLSQVLTNKYDKIYLMPIIELIWSSRKLQKKIEEKMGTTLLHLACYVVDDEKISEQLGKGVSVNSSIRNDSSIWPGYTPLHILITAPCAMSEHLKLLLDAKADVTLANAEGDTVVHKAIKVRRSDFENMGNARASSLMKYQVDFTTNPTNKFGMSHFHVVCLLNDVRAVKGFLGQIPNIDINQQISTADDSKFAGHTPLLLALSSRVNKHYNPEAQVHLVQLLLDRGANVHAVDAFGATPLHKLAACTPTRVKLLHQILIDDIDINKRTVDGTTPMEILLSDGAPNKEIHYFVKRGARVNGYNLVSGVGYMAIVVTSKKYKKSREANTVLEMMTNSRDIAEVSDTGRNSIHHAVASSNENLNITAYEYFRLVEKLITLGCDIFQQDIQGRTALHLAVNFQNKQALIALLECGADINIVDSVGMPPFFYASVLRKDKRSWISSDSNAEVCIILALHLIKLQLVGLQISKLNSKILSEVLSERDDIHIEFKENIVNRQLERAAKIRMCDRGFTLCDFLYATGPITSLKTSDRRAIDSFFKRGDDKEFPELKGLLKLQYKNVLQRPSLIAPALGGLNVLLRFPLPELCAQIILTYLTNLDLKNLTAAAT